MAEITTLITFEIDDQALQEAGQKVNNQLQSEFQLTEKELDNLIKQVEDAIELVKRLQTIQDLELSLDLILLLKGRKAENLSPSLVREAVRQFLNLKENFIGQVEVQIISSEASLLVFKRLAIELGLLVNDLTAEQEKQALARLDNINRRLEELQQAKEKAIQRIIGPPDELTVLQTELELLLEQLNRIKESGGEINIPIVDETALKGAEEFIKRLENSTDGIHNAFDNIQSAFSDIPESAFDKFKSLRDIFPDIGDPQPQLTLELFIDPKLNPGLEQTTNNAIKLNDEINRGNGIYQEQSSNATILENAIAKLGVGFTSGAVAQSEFENATGNAALALDDASASIENAEGNTKQLAEEAQNASVVLDGLAVFAADVAANINDSFADLIFNSLKGNFDSLGDLWRSTLDSMLETLSQFLATVISNPIRLSLESFLTGGSSGKGLLSGITGLGGTLGLGSSGLFGASGSFTALGALFTGNSSVGFGTTLLGAIPAIGAIAAAAAIAIPLIADAFKKTPRLDLDFDQLRDDAGKSLGVAAQVFQFLDEDVFNNEIFSRSVSRKAGLGLGSELPNVIREAIEGQINVIQDIINQLPFELAAQLNDALLNTSVDIESKIKGDRLLEFDETNVVSLNCYRNVENEYKLAA